jgi:hypothetical protein
MGYSAINGKIMAEYYLTLPSMAERGRPPAQISANNNVTAIAAGAGHRR